MRCRMPVDGAMKGHFEATGDRPALQPDVKMVGGEEWKEGQDVVVRDDLRDPVPRFRPSTRARSSLKS